VIVRWGLDELPGLLDEVGVEAPLLVASERWRPNELPVPRSAVWTEVPSDRIPDAVVAAEGADGILALGGGSAIDLGKAISSAGDLPLVSVPTTYAGAEWTPYFGVRDPGRRIRGGGGGAQLAGALYEPHLTLSLPRAETVGTAMNALAHCAEALYVHGHNSEADEHALAGARLISEWLPRVVEAPDDLEARTRLLEGAMHAGAALGKSMLALGHAMAQAVGGRYGIAHGAANAVCLPPALRFNAEVAPDALARLGEALGGEPVERVRELATLGGYDSLSGLGVPEGDLAELAEAAAQRNGAKMNPRPASPAQIEQLLRSVY
jgi:maleylacetate reductase